MDSQIKPHPVVLAQKGMFIATVIDRNFVELAGVMLRSLVMNGNIGNTQIVVVGDRLKQDDINKLKVCAAPRELIFVDIPNNILSEIDILPTNSNWSRTIYARLLLPRLLGPEAARVLYIDADVLVLNDLQPLLSLDMQEYPVAARGGIEQKTLARLELAPGTKTLNSGVLLFDVKRWQEERVSEKCFEVAKSNCHKLKFFDQDMLNIALGGHFLSLPERWNDYGYSDPSKIGILHFIHEKPNSVRCNHPAKDLYLEYRRSTPWAQKPLQSKWHKRFKRIKFSLRRKMGLV